MAPKSSHMTNSQPSLPVDRGWAWLIMLGAFSNTFFAFSFIRSLSIFFIEFLEKFQQSATVTTSAFGLNTAAFSISAILVPPFLLSRFSVRSVTIVGAVLNATSIIGLAFSPNMIWITIMLFILGLSHPLIYISQVTLLGVYFKKRLSFAVGFANLGLSIGLMCGPSLTRALLDSYGLLGALLIHGGLNLNNIAACMLFRPPSFYATDTTSLEDNESSESVKSESRSSVNKFDPKFARYTQTTTHCENLKNNPNTLNDEMDKEIMNNHLIESARENDNIVLDYPHIIGTPNGDGNIVRAKSHQMLNDRKIVDHSQNALMNEKGRHTASELCIVTSHSKSFLNNSNIISNSPSKRSFIDVVTSLKSVQYLSSSTIHLNKIFSSLTGSTTQDINTDADSQFSKMLSVDIEDHSLNSGETEKACCCRRGSSLEAVAKKKSVCCHPVGIMLLLMVGIGVNTQCAAAYMPSLGKENGLAPDQLPILMTVIGACDLCKIAAGYLADKGWVRGIHIVMVCQLMIGITFQFSSYFKGFVSMVILCGIFGANTGVAHILLPGITIDMLGVEYIGQVMSGYFLINGVVMSTTHVLIGSLKDTTGSFTGGYHFIGALVLFSVIVIMMEPVFKSLASRQMHHLDSPQVEMSCDDERCEE